MMPSFSTSEPIMNPGTSARYSSGMLNASHHQMNRAALSAESTNSTPPLTAGWLATTPTGWPSSSASPVTSSGANAALSSRKEPSSTRPSITSRMSYPAASSTGMSALVSARAGASAVYDG